MLPPRSHRRPLPPFPRLSVLILLSLASIVFLATLSAASPTPAVDARTLSDTLSPHVQSLLAREPPDYLPGELDGEDPTDGKDDGLEEVEAVEEEEEEEEETKPEPGDPEISVYEIEEPEVDKISEPVDTVPATTSAGELTTATGLPTALEDLEEPVADVTIDEKPNTSDEKILLEDEDEGEAEEEIEGEKTNEIGSSEIEKEKDVEEKLNDIDLVPVQNDKEPTFEDEVGLNEEDSLPETEELLTPETEELLTPETEELLTPETEELLTPETEELLTPETEELLIPETEELLTDADKTSEVDVNVGKPEEDEPETETKLAAKPPVELEEVSVLPVDDELSPSDAKDDEAALPPTNTETNEDLDNPTDKITNGNSDADELDHPVYEEDEAIPEDGTVTQESEIDPDSELVVSQEVVYLFLIVLGSVAILAMKGTRAIVVSLFGNVFGGDKGDYHHLPTHNDGLADTHGIPLTSPRAHPPRSPRAPNPAPASAAWAVDMSDVIDIPTPRSQPGSKKGMQLQGRASKPSSGSNSNGTARATTAPPGGRAGGQHGQQQVGSTTATADASWDSWKDGDEDW